MLSKIEDDKLREVAKAAKERNACKKSLYQFVKSFWPVIVPDTFVDNWHIKFLCDEIQPHLERVINREPKEKDIPINVPPGTTKTLILSVFAPVWVWVKDAGIRFITGSHDSMLANEAAVKSRDILKSDKFGNLWPGLIKFKPDMDMKSGYANSRGGSRKTCSVGGNITGHHAHIIIIDDPLNPKKAASEVEKKTANDWLDKTLSSRKVDKKITLTILIMQRLAEDDCTGHWLEKGKDLMHICLPGEITDLGNVKPEKAKKHYINGLLDPERMSRGVLDEMRIDMGSKEYSGQVLQYPQAMEGTIFKREAWKYYTDLPNEPILRKIWSWDTAFTKDKQNAFTAGLYGIQYKSGLYLIKAKSEHLDFPELKDFIVLSNSGNSATHLLIENKASGISLLQVLQKEYSLPLVPIQPDRDKIARAHASTPYIEAGNVFLPIREGWTDKFVDTMAGFPDIKYKDMVDALTQMIMWLINNAATITAPKSRKIRPRGITSRF